VIAVDAVNVAEVLVSELMYGAAELSMTSR
jgi:hypothetical protein